MLIKLRKKLTIHYTCITGAILSIVVIILALLAGRGNRNASEALFTNQLMTIANKLQYDSHISQNWLASMEADNHLLIHIEENGRPLLYSGTTITATDRPILIERARQLALDETIDTDIPPVSTSLERSSLMNIRGNRGDYYLGTVIVFSSKSSYFTLILLQDITSTRHALWLQWLLFLLADILGILCLLAVNWIFVGRALEPILVNEQKQHAFIAAASHELRSPLAVIEASTDAILTTPASMPRFASNIKEECHRMSRLLEDMLLLASAKSRPRPLTCAAVDIDTLLLNTYERYEALYIANHRQLTLKLPEDSLPELSSDEEKIMHILSIFLDNAMSYAPTDSHVALTAECSHSHLMIAVVDHGNGIPDDKKEQVFGYFYRADLSRKDKQHFGLGLSVAAELAKQLAAELKLTDTPGGGCTFQLLLPLASSPSNML